MICDTQANLASGVRADDFEEAAQSRSLKHSLHNDQAVWNWSYYCDSLCPCRLPVHSETMY